MEEKKVSEQSQSVKQKGLLITGLLFFLWLDSGLGEKNAERVGRDKTKTLKQKQKTRKVGALRQQIRHEMIKWEKNYKGQPASVRGPDLDNSSERLGKSLRTPEKMVLCPQFPVHCIQYVPTLPSTSPQASKGVYSIDTREWMICIVGYLHYLKPVP